MKMENIRSIVRPLLTVTGWLMVLYLVVIDTSIREFFLGTITLMIGYWFGQRKSP